MIIDDLEEILEGAIETPKLEFKESCEWNVKVFVKDILALSNIQDGGYIIIGVEDKSFERKGVKEDHKKTYKIEQMRDQMAVYADPHVNFHVEFPSDRMGKEYIVIRVFEFNEIPVICKKDHYDVKAGVIYYRSSKGKISSAAISSSHDLRNVIEIATVKMMQRKTSLGFTVDASISTKFNDELEGL